ncbi:alpha/beta hydrolase fold domain-containing protein [bacterium]|nr:alpha/beta hydrolase fold domain-containing protein [bacterium]
MTESLAAESTEPREELLWPEGAPGAKGQEEKDQPTLTYYLPDPDEANGAAVIICPGGGYSHLAMDHEGHQVGKWLNQLGVAGIILKYRLPRNGYPHPAPLHDAMHAMRTIRAKAAELGIDADQIGIMGFSAGGHLASTLGTHFDYGEPNAQNPIDTISSRPNFMILIYPVVSMGKYTHKGSRRNLLGPNPSDALIDLLSNENQVTPTTPQTFLLHAYDDGAVPVENSVNLFSQLRLNGIPTEMHIFQRGGHGFGMRKKDPVISQWPKLVEDWMRVRQIIPN